MSNTGNVSAFFNSITEFEPTIVLAQAKPDEYQAIYAIAKASYDDIPDYKTFSRDLSQERSNLIVATYFDFSREYYQRANAKYQTLLTENKDQYEQYLAEIQQFAHFPPQTALQIKAYAEQLKTTQDKYPNIKRLVELDEEREQGAQAIGGFLLLNGNRIERLAVSPDCRRRGIGTMFLENFKQSMINQGYGGEEFIIQSDTITPEAAAFLTKLGFDQRKRMRFSRGSNLTHLPEIKSPVDMRWLIRPDMDAVLDIEKEGSKNPWSMQNLHDVLKQRNSIGFVAVCPKTQKIKGYAIYELNNTKINIIKLVTAPDARHQGIGTQLFIHMANKLVDRRFFLDAEIESDEAEVFANATGMEEMSPLFYWQAPEAPKPQPQAENEPTLQP